MSNRKSWISLGSCLVGLFGLAVLRSLFQKDHSLIKGIGNSSNRIYVDPVTDELAAVLAGHPTTATITDEELRKTFNAIRERAHQGDLKAALVLFRVAAMQRTRK